VTFHRPFTRGLGFVATYGLLILVVVAALGPTLWVMLSSFKTSPQILSPDGSLQPDPWTLQGYRDVFGQAHLHRYLLNTFLYAAGGTLGALTAALLAAYPTARLRFPFRHFFTVAFSVALAIPIIGLIVPEFFIMRHLGLFDTKVGLVIFYSAMFFPISFVILRAFLAGLPYEIEEAAIMDGAGYFTIIRRIIVPLAMPGLVTVAVLVFIFIWNEYFFAQLFTLSFDNFNIQLTLAQFRSAFERNTAGALAGASLAMLVPITAFLFLQRFVVAGLTAGSSR
jgi:ABC-type glycerol-3-phosphate transport system permease component